MPVRQDQPVVFVGIQELATLTDPVIAGVDLVANIAHRHHDMMAGWGRPDRACGMYHRATGSGSIIIPCRVPPGVEEMDIALLVWGIGRAKLTCATDATGTFLRSLNLPTPQLAEWVETGGPIDSSEGPESGRALTVSASAVWAFQDINITVDIDDVNGEFGIAGVWWRPIRQLRT
jgi:hypothetical protein